MSTARQGWLSTALVQQYAAYLGLKKLYAVFSQHRVSKQQLGERKLLDANDNIASENSSLNCHLQEKNEHASVIFLLSCYLVIFLFAQRRSSARYIGGR